MIKIEPKHVKERDNSKIHIRSHFLLSACRFVKTVIGQSVELNKTTSCRQVKIRMVKILSLNLLFLKEHRKTYTYCSGVSKNSVTRGVGKRRSSLSHAHLCMVHLTTLLITLIVASNGKMFSEYGIGK